MSCVYKGNDAAGNKQGFPTSEKFRKSMIEMCVGIGRWAAMGMKTLVGGWTAIENVFSLSPPKKSVGTANKKKRVPYFTFL